MYQDQAKRIVAQELLTQYPGDHSQEKVFLQYRSDEPSSLQSRIWHDLFHRRGIKGFIMEIILKLNCLIAAVGDHVDIRV
jgi:hypothetical protein